MRMKRSKSQQPGQEAEAQETWAHLQSVARKVTADYPDAVFIGGIAVATHATRLGPEFSETSHDADLYLSLQGKAIMRDRYEIWRTPHLNKDSTIIDGEDIDLYVEHQHPLGVPYAAIYAHAEEVDHIRVAALEHLLVLKCDAAKDRHGSGKGDKDDRDLARIVLLMDEPRGDLLAPFLLEQRRTTLEQAVTRPDLVQVLGLNPHQGSRIRTLILRNLQAILEASKDA